MEWTTNFAFIQATKNGKLVIFLGDLTILNKCIIVTKNMAPSIKDHLVQEREYLQSIEIISHNNNPPPPSLGDDVTPRRLKIQ